MFRNRLFSRSLLIVGYSASLMAASFAEKQPPNLVFILADDLGWADTTLYGKTDLYQTPNLERLRERGMLFTQAYAASPLCSPTRSAILSGLSPARTGITYPMAHSPQVVMKSTVPAQAAPGQKTIMPRPVTRLDTSYPTIVKALKSAGYAAGHFGKWHLGSEPFSPLEHGFDVDLPHYAGYGPAGNFVAPWEYESFDPDPEIPNEHIEDRMAKEAVAWMEAHKEGPFFLNYWQFSVHSPFDAKADLIEKYRALIDPYSSQRSPTYAAMVESMDDAIGTLMDAIDRLGIADNTIIIFTSDNGGNMYGRADNTLPTSNAPLRGGKATIFEGGTRIPCIVAWPGLTQAGSTSDALIQSEDFFPTLLANLGIAPVEGQIFDGIDITPALKGEQLERNVLFQYFPHILSAPDWLPPSMAMREGDWKMIRIFHGDKDQQHRHLLYHLKTDLGEVEDLSKENPEIVAKMSAQMDKFLAETGAVLPLPNPAFDPKQFRPEQIGVQRPQRRRARGANRQQEQQGQRGQQQQGQQQQGQ